MAAVATRPAPAPIPFCRTKRLACPEPGCTKAYNRPALLEQHRRSHSNERPFACPHDPCAKSFTRQAHLTRHVQSAHDNVRTYVCDFDGCAKSFATGTRLRRHTLSHENRAKHRCTEDGCNKSFRKAATLAKHRVTAHEGRAAFTCDEPVGGGAAPCGREFNDAYGLKVHRERNHIADRFQCTICQASSEGERSGMAFATYSELQTHNRTVHPPTCSDCGRVCRSPADLAQHFDTYHNPEPVPKKTELHRCTEAQCEAKFERKSSLTNHVKNAHSTRRPFACNATDASTLHRVGDWTGADACDRSFKTKARLEKHIRKVHLSRNAQGEAAELAFADREPPRKRRKTGRVPAIERLVGSESSLCLVPGCSFRSTGDADLFVHLQTRHGLAAAEVRELQGNNPDDAGEASESDLDPDEVRDALEWDRELEMAAASGGRFWLADGEDVVSDEWEADEMEMQRLVGPRENGQLPVDPMLK